MTNRALWLLVFVGFVGVAAAGVFRALPWLLMIAAAAAAWATATRRSGIVVAASIAAVAWASAIGPWSGSIRWWAALAAGAVAAVAVIVIRPRAKLIAVALVSVWVVSAFLFVRPPPVTGATPTSASARDIDNYMRHQVDRADIPGAAVAVIEHGNVVFARGYGRAHDTVAMTPNTPVVIGSTSKSLTAMVVLQLSEQGRIELDAPISRYLAWLAPADGRLRSVTVRQLLIDTSGIPTWAGWSALAGDGRADTPTIEHLINHIHLTSAPGQRFQYSNANYIILGQVIEAVTTRPYDVVVRQTVFEPLGMSNTRAASTPQSTPNRYWFGLPVPSHLPYLQIGVPAGAITSSASDLARYLQAELGDGQPPTVLSSASLRLSQTPAVKAEGFGVEPGLRYAMGWYTGSIAGERAVFHTGDVFDSSSSLIMLPDRDIGIAVVATTSSALIPVAKTLGDGVAATLLRRQGADFSRSFALATLVAVAAAGMVVAFAAVRARRLIAGGLRVHSPASLVRVTVIDLAIPLAILIGLPKLFSNYLDQAETVSAWQLWRLIARGVPDVGLLLVVALAARAAIAIPTVLRSLSPRHRRTSTPNDEESFSTPPNNDDRTPAIAVTNSA